MSVASDSAPVDPAHGQLMIASFEPKIKEFSERDAAAKAEIEQLREEISQLRGQYGYALHTQGEQS